MEKVKITAVSYLNTKPLLYGLLHHPISEQIDLQIDIPADCAKKLIQNEVDLALVPVATIPLLKNPKIISDFCIGTEGAVKTVCIYSDRPIQDLKQIYLDFHSRTSVQLTKLLLQEYWQLNPILLDSKEGYIDQIGGYTGGLVIGDRTIGLEDRFQYAYDLGEIWEKHSQLPFVFAAWVSNKNLPIDFIQGFNEALQEGLNHIPQLKLLLPNPHPEFDLEEYFTKYISYHLDAPKKQALKKFLHFINEGLQIEIGNG